MIKAIPQVLAALNKYPGYSLLILGYSLGRVKIQVYLIWAQYILIYQFVSNNYVFDNIKMPISHIVEFYSFAKTRLKSKVFSLFEILYSHYFS